ncbi:hypothetical protein CU663_16945 [Pseudomonas syringae pv. actinidifoliorum]|nr:hypothetical protein [Pseudomonas syringae pv. actinidifoliorum]
MAMPSAETRTALKMPVAMPARSFSTTLTAMPSIKPQGRPIPIPINAIGSRAMWVAPLSSTSASQARPAATSTNPTPDSHARR